ISVFGVKEAKRMDRFVQFAVAASLDAVKDSGLDVLASNPDRIGVIVGSGIGGMQTIEEQHRIMFERGPDRISPFFIPLIIVNMAAGMISIKTGAKGPNACITTACASASHSIGEAARLIGYGDADAMIAGGSEASIAQMGIGGFCAMKALSTRRNDNPATASRPFDKERDGFVMGEGAGIVILEELENAKKRGAHIYAELVGYGLTGDAHHMTAPAPCGEGAARCMKMAIDNAQLNPEQVDYVNAHGTSTQLNDLLETQAIKTVFKDHAAKLAVNSTKSMIGHLLGAAGAVELVATILQMTHKTLHPTINQENADPECDLDYVPNKAREKNITVAVSNSLGFGGHNACLVVRKY
ncbi:MAG: beta-ketoacyl-ACP synthase II, partial [Chlamydiota bacterium]|nr:beta-ketoacyl-ACP synthase II [Chlamydiota bacterium]